MCLAQEFIGPLANYVTFIRLASGPWLGRAIDSRQAGGEGVSPCRTTPDDSPGSGPAGHALGSREIRGQVRHDEAIHNPGPPHRPEPGLDKTGPDMRRGDALGLRVCGTGPCRGPGLRRESAMPCNATSQNPRICLLYTSPSPRDLSTSRMPSSA